jgi:hypothetical protein
VAPVAAVVPRSSRPTPSRLARWPPCSGGGGRRCPPAWCAAPRRAFGVWRRAARPGPRAVAPSPLDFVLRAGGAPAPSEPARGRPLRLPGEGMP